MAAGMVGPRENAGCWMQSIAVLSLCCVVFSCVVSLCAVWELRTLFGECYVCVVVNSNSSFCIL